MSDYPIMVHSIFPTWSVSNRFHSETQLEEWLAKWKLNIVATIRVEGYLSITAISEEITDYERVI